MNKIIKNSILSILLILVFSTLAFSMEKDQKTFIYTVCEDRRIYLIDLEKNIIVHKSNIVTEIGRPISIAIDLNQKILYVGSERGHRQKKYSPIVKIDISSPEPKNLNNFYLIQGQSEGPFNDVYAVYNIILSPDREKLYVGYSHPDYSRFTTVIDPKSGKIEGKVKIPIDYKSIFSPDGKKVVRIWPKGSKIIRKDGKRKVRSWDSGIVTYDIEKGKKVFMNKKRKGDGGLHPYWGQINKPLVYLRHFKTIELFNRNTGERISSIDINSLSDDLKGSTRYPLLLENNTKAVLPMICRNFQGYIVVLDLKNKKVVSRLKIGKGPTNAVFAD